MRRALLLSTVAAVLLGSYIVYSSFMVSQSTGLLKVSSAGATITVVEPGSQQVTIGTNKGVVRLTPGSYQVIVTKSRQQAVKTVAVVARTTTSITLATVTPAQQEQARNAATANTLINSLPFVGPDSEYEISYQYQTGKSTSQPIIIISAPTVSAQQDGLAWIKSQGYNPSTLTIQYQTVPMTNNNYTNGYPGN